MGHGIREHSLQHDGRGIPLQTRSCVLTCVPSSIVCNEKSISGISLFFANARATCGAVSILLSSSLSRLIEGQRV